MLTAKFEKGCDNFKKVEGKNPNTLPAFLAIFAPLVFSPLTCVQVVDNGSDRPPVPLPAPSSADTNTLVVPRVPEKNSLERLVPPPSTSLLQYEEEDSAEDTELLVKHGAALDALWVTPELEVRLIRDLLFVFQGIPGKHIKYDPRSEAFLLDPSLPLRSHVKDL